MFKEQDIESIKAQFEQQLLSQERVSFSFDRNWSSNFPNKPGIYAIFDNSELRYIGETADLKERMKDVKRTVNHTFRRKLGKAEFNGTLVKRKFTKDIETRLNDYYLSNLTFVGIPVHFGRIEIETYLINKHINSLLNTQGKRGQNKG